MYSWNIFIYLPTCITVPIMVALEGSHLTISILLPYPSSTCSFLALSKRWLIFHMDCLLETFVRSGFYPRTFAVSCLILALNSQDSSFCNISRHFISLHTIFCYMDRPCTMHLSLGWLTFSYFSFFLLWIRYCYRHLCMHFFSSAKACFFWACIKE